tara:strand:- start:56 stop:208 length:153 start_codon:yes stop_codon:yes gene_type:complete
MKQDQVRTVIYRAYRMAIDSIQSKGGEATSAIKRYNKIRRWKSENRGESS